MYHQQPNMRMPPALVANVLDAVLRLNLQPSPGGACIVPITHKDVEDLLFCSLGVVGLWPSQQIVAHRDAPIRAVRHHIPLQQNSGCWSFSGGVWQQLETGKVYRMDPTEEHGAVNWGSEVRLHLMIDVVPT